MIMGWYFCVQRLFILSVICGERENKGRLTYNYASLSFFSKYCCLPRTLNIFPDTVPGLSKSGVGQVVKRKESPAAVGRRRESEEFLPRMTASGKLLLVLVKQPSLQTVGHPRSCGHPKPLHADAVLLTFASSVRLHWPDT